MAFLGWMCLGGTTILNDCQTLARIADGYGPPGIECRQGDPCCADLSAGLGYPNGYNPSETPWYDGSQESIDFAGLLVQSIDGLEPGNFTRPVTESAGYGAVIGQGRQSAPTIVVSALVMAASCAGTEFGISWLRSALRGSCSASLTCAGDELLFLAAEPETPDLDCEENQPFDFEAWLAPYYRTLKNVALVDGPHVVERIARACPECAACGIPRVEFTLAAARPCVYRDPVAITDGMTDMFVFDCDLSDDDCVQWVTEDCVDCPPVDNCASDPNCQDIVAPPAVPAITNPCIDDCINALECRVCVNIDGGIFPSVGEGTLIITVDNTAGLAPIRRLKVQLWQNPLSLDVSMLSDCISCSELNISYVAPGSALVIDGSTGTSTIVCPGGQSVRANPFISSGSGSPSFSYPVIDPCRGNHTLCVTATGPIPEQAFLTIDAVGREC